MTVGDLLNECDRARKQGLKYVVLRIERHGGAWMQVMKGLLGNVIGSDKTGSFVSVDILKAESKAVGIDPATEIPKVSAHRSKVTMG